MGASDMSQGCSLGPSTSAGPINRSYRTNNNQILASGGRVPPRLTKFGKSWARFPRWNWRISTFTRGKPVKRIWPTFKQSDQMLVSPAKGILYCLIRRTNFLNGIPDQKQDPSKSNKNRLSYRIHDKSMRITNWQSSFWSVELKLIISTFQPPNHHSLFTSYLQLNSTYHLA